MVCGVLVASRVRCYLTCINIVTAGMIIYDLNLAYAKQENNLTQHGRCVCLTSLSFVVFFYERVRVEVNYIEMYVIS